MRNNFIVFHLSEPSKRQLFWQFIKNILVCSDQCWIWRLKIFNNAFRIWCIEALQLIGVLVTVFSHAASHPCGSRLPLTKETNHQAVIIKCLQTYAKWQAFSWTLYNLALETDVPWACNWCLSYLCLKAACGRTGNCDEQTKNNLQKKLDVSFPLSFRFY